MKDKNIAIVLDAMGGDNAPHVTVEGAVEATRISPIKVILVGDEKAIEKELKKYTYNASQLEIVNTPHHITMEENPKEAIEKKPDASIVLATKLVAEEQGNALVSAGSTGAVILAAAKNINRILGVHKSALAASYPTHNFQKRQDIFSLLLDVGANIHNSHHDLVHFAYMGATYAREIKKIENPTVGLLNIGSEPYKGGKTLSQTYAILKTLPDINFIGNVEGDKLMLGLADVVITEGLTGNIALKVIEGVASSAQKLLKQAFRENFLWKMGLMMLSGGIRKLKNITDYQEYGGAPIFGFNKMIIKCHGRSTSLAIKNGLLLAAKSVQDDITEQISRYITNYEYNHAVHDVEV
ncbi:MAG: phosphate acyltransferase PlsX [Candidatus Marinimicrobia bacterium]|nr:phosphate acyltransferase PlsX [Candidatus Neomarinimicrobiota bacterium]MDD5582920.1 phosphate acyltransferase PlsX [Candidatus Neomarinimicrobiota bacterium]